MKSTPVHPSVKACLGMAFSVLFAGCSTSTYIVQVDAVAKPTLTPGEAQPQSYQIRTTNPKMDEGSLRYKEVAGYVKTALSGKGMYEAPRADKADVVIDIDYGIDSPRVKFDTQSMPVYTTTGGGVRYEQVPVYGVDPTTLKPILLGYRTVMIREPMRQQLLTFEDVVRPVIVYEKYLKISARTNKEPEEGRAPAEVWSVNVSAEDESKELRKYLPILASATADFIGTNTKQETPVKLKDSDEVVSFIKKGM
jgi:hypothetical protein